MHWLYGSFFVALGPGKVYMHDVFLLHYVLPDQALTVALIFLHYFSLVLSVVLIDAEVLNFHRQSRLLRHLCLRPSTCSLTFNLHLDLAHDFDDETHLLHVGRRRCLLFFVAVA